MELTLYYNDEIIDKRLTEIDTKKEKKEIRYALNKIYRRLVKEKWDIDTVEIYIETDLK